MPRPLPRAGGRRYGRPTTRSDTGQSRRRTTCRRRVALAKKVLDDLLAKTEDQTKPNARRPQFLSRPPHRGSVRVTSQNLLLNLYSLVKEHSVSRAPPNAEETVGRRICRRTLSSSADHFDRRLPDDLICCRGRNLARKDEIQVADQTGGASFQLSLRSTSRCGSSNFRLVASAALPRHQR